MEENIMAGELGENIAESAAPSPEPPIDEAENARVKQFNKNKWLFSTGGIGRDMSYQLIAAFLLVYVQFGVSLTLAQFTTLSLIIGVGGRIWDAINDPMMGAIIEGTHMKWGKFKPWILIGAVTCGLVILAMFNVRIWSGWNFVAFMTVMYLLWETTFTMNDIGYWAMLPSLSSKKNERNSVTMLTVIFAGVGAFVAQGMVIFLTPGNVVGGYRLVSIIIVAAFIGFQLLTTLGVKETPRELNEKKKEGISIKHMLRTIKNNDQVLWMTLSMLFYNIGSNLLVALAYNLYYLEVGYDNKSFYFVVIFGVCNVAVNILYPKLAQWLGRKKLQTVSALVTVIGYIGITLIGWWPDVLPFNILTLGIFGVLVFSGQALFYMVSIINMTNCVEYNEFKQGERNEAVVSTLRPFMAKFASAMEYGIVTLVLAVSGVFVLSQNISLMESQKDYLSNINGATAQVEYIESIEYYLGIFDTHEEDEAIEIVTEELAADTEMSKYQLRAEYIKSLADCKIYRETKVDGKTVEGSRVELGYWRDLNDAELIAEAPEGEYVYTMELVGDGFNAANENFRNVAKDDIKMRLIMRAAVTLVPILLMISAWLIQEKKFIIDEKYYDMMLVEIDKRKTAEGGSEAAGESASEPTAE
jgi:sugar (glycoside-pentoside-hexuronide) transporter